MATCDLSFVVPSDLSLWIFIWTEAKLDFSLPMPAPTQDGAPLNPKKLETASQIVLLNPLAFFIGAGAGGLGGGGDSAKISLFFFFIFKSSAHLV